MMTQPTNILILGGGYAGVMAALRLAHKTKRNDTTITLINGRAHFVERLRLHEMATGTDLPRRSIAQMLRGTKAQFRQAWITAIDPAAQVVQVQSAEGEEGDEQIPYDYLINALGSHVHRGDVPGVADYAYTLDPGEGLETDALRTRLMTFSERPLRAVVVGGGATGVETATQIRGTIPHAEVTLVTQGKMGAFKGERIRQHIAAAMSEQSITVYEESQVARVEPNGVVLADGQIAADVIVWAGGFHASPLAAEAGLRVNERGQMLVDPCLRSLSHPTIFAAGDAMIPVEEPGAPIRMSVFTAVVSGAQVGDNVAAVVKGRSPKPLSYVWYGQGIALGPNDAVGFPTYPVDEPRFLVFRRGLAVRIRNFFVWYLTFALDLERRIPGAFFWNGKGRYGRRQRRSGTSSLKAGI